MRNQDDELLDALGEDTTPVQASWHTPQEARLIAGFEDILRFVDTHGRVPLHGEDRDVFERIYAVRLDRLRAMPDAFSLLVPLDIHGLLTGERASVPIADDLDDDALLAELDGDNDITQLRHVRSFEERKAAEEIANRTKCEDFDQFKPLFDKVQRELKSAERRTITLETRSLDEIQKGTFFIVGGQVAYIAEEMGEFTTDYHRRDMRLRVIYDNGTESEVLQRSLQRALHRDKVARLISEPTVGPLFGDTQEPDDIESGTIYVLRSQSLHPYVVEHHDLIHKIGVTGGKVETRIANAVNDATYLLAQVDVVASYKLANINRTKMENLFHKIFAPAQLKLTIDDRFGNPVHPREWFLVPIQVIDEAVALIRDGTITDYVYDPATAKLVRHK